MMLMRVRFFLNILNSQHDNIKFTIEKSTNTLQFLDVDIKISENTVDIWVWRKRGAWPGFEKGEGGGFFERVRKVQTTLTRTFIVL